LKNMGDENLRDALSRHFGFSRFRPYQEEVCRAALEGEDLLLVMPTGSGKSLCYQLPGIMRGGATLVISPLIALMEDQVSKLKALGIRADRFHSGMNFEGIREAGIAWRERRLDFLFIAPERLAVSWFPKFLEDYPPNLVAVDEAHCISQWGHDFRPDYRLVGQRLPRSEGTPLLAMTATATPRVQEDILTQLEIPRARRFIRGFRRENLAIECLDVPPSSRSDIVLKLLSADERRPAIVYAPSRKETESVAETLAPVSSAAAYHAGLSSSRREKVQNAFMNGELDIVVATIAFGMGVDKADIRTVVHTALPGSIENYYQEIGRAGRDGLPSRAVLLFSWADRRTHEYFHGKDYPPPEELELVYEKLGDSPIDRHRLEAECGLNSERLLACLNQLWIHGGALVDPEERALKGTQSWRLSYPLQRRHRLEQLEAIFRFASSSSTCRMKSLVLHFGDSSDTGGDCGLCDVCASPNTLAIPYRNAAPEEISLIRDILATLGEYDGRTTGQLFKELGPRGDRRDFKEVLNALAREGLIEIRPDSFVKEGRTIHFERVYLTHEAALSGIRDLSRIRIASRIPSKAKARTGRSPKKKKAAPEIVALDRAQLNLLDELRAWRLGEARRRRIPAFRIMGDRTLEALVRIMPSNEDELLGVPGIGPVIARKYGTQLLEILS